jgi:hypothetical protein
VPSASDPTSVFSGRRGEVESSSLSGRESSE